MSRTLKERAFNLANLSPIALGDSKGILGHFARLDKYMDKGRELMADVGLERVLVSTRWYHPKGTVWRHEAEANYERLLSGAWKMEDGACFETEETQRKRRRSSAHFDDNEDESAGMKKSRTRLKSGEEEAAACDKSDLRATAETVTADQAVAGSSPDVQVLEETQPVVSEESHVATKVREFLWQQY